LHEFDIIYLKKICNKYMKNNLLNNEQKNNINIVDKCCQDCKKKD
jgi:hypothetical protein